MRRHLASAARLALALSALTLTGCVENGLKARAYSVNIAHLAPEANPIDGAGSMPDPRAIASVRIEE